MTIYDPYSVAYIGYGNGSYAPGGRDLENAPYTVAKNLIRAHARVYAMYNSDYKAVQKGLSVSICRCIRG